VRIDENGKPKESLKALIISRGARYRFHNLLLICIPKSHDGSDENVETVKLVGLGSTGATFHVANSTNVPIRIKAINVTIYVNETIFGRCFQSFNT